MLDQYISAQQPSSALIKLLDSPRARLLDLSYLDSRSGRTVLHEAALRKDLRLIEASVRAGADVFVRDRRGKAVGEGGGGGKDDRVRVFLRQCAYSRLAGRRCRLTLLVHSHEPGPDAHRGVQQRAAGAQGVPAQVHQRRERVQPAVVRAQGRHPLMHVIPHVPNLIPAC